MYDVLVKNGRIVTADRVSEGNIAIRDGKIAAVLNAGEEPEACFTITGLFLGQSIRLSQITLFPLLHVLLSHAHICDAYKYGSMHAYGVCGLLLLSVRE